MAKIIFDTNIYGRLIKETDFDIKEIQFNLIRDNKIHIYGIDCISEEIVSVSKWKTEKLTEAILELYKLLTQKEYICDSNIKKLAEEYFKLYKKLRGKKKWNMIKKDLYIVACATLKKADIIYSGDRESMDSRHPLGQLIFKVYDRINLFKGYRNPEFKSYDDLRLYIKNNYTKK